MTSGIDETEGLAAIETPALVVDLDRVHQNVDRVARYASAHNLSLRPHVKTHKSVQVAARQLEAGAVGLTCATLREAEAMGAVARDLFVAHFPVGAPKLKRLLSLPNSIRLSTAVDSLAAVGGLAAAAGRMGRQVDVLVEIDVGMGRVGVAGPAEAIALADRIRSNPPLRYAGITFYPGHIRELRPAQDSELERVAQRVADIHSALSHEGFDPERISGGSTPTLWRSHEIAGLTEIRPGTYVYNDRTTAAIGACGWDDCAATILATVVSTAVPKQAVIDAGSKALGREPLRAPKGDGFGQLLEHPDVIVRAMSEEHGLLDISKTDWRPSIGERVRVIPNHVCVAVHLFDSLWVVGKRGVRGEWVIEARGRR